MAARSFILYGGLVENAWGYEILLSCGHQISCFIFLLLKQFDCPCCSDLCTHLFTKIFGEKLGYNNEYENADVNIWLLNNKVDKWGIELMMETPHIEWCFQFDKWKDLDEFKYAHVVNFKAYKDDPQQVVVFLLVPFFPLQVKIICLILKMDNNLHSKSYEKGKFRVAKFPNKITKLTH